MVIGSEGRVVLRDAWDLEEHDAERVTAWIVTTLADAALEQQPRASFRASVRVVRAVA